MATQSALTVNDVIDSRPVSGFQATTILLCGLVLLLDGFDTQAMGFLVPPIAEELGIPLSAFGPVLSAGLFGLMLGAMGSGPIADRWGRKWVAVPCLAILAVGFLLLPLTTEMTGFVLVAMLTGFGNGLGAGIIQTLGADFAPEFRRGEFLGIWRLIGDTGSAVGPLVVSFVISVATLALASVVCGGIGLVGAVLMAALIPETLRLSKPDEAILREEAEPLSDTS